MTGRFINADDISCLGANGDLTGYNLFAYCSNNPVMGYDPYGQFDLIGIFKGISEALTDWAVRETEKAINRFIRNLEEDIADFDKNNADPEACVKSNYFSMYNGTPVISFNLFGLNSFSIGGIIFLEGTASANTVLHEYGHIQQEEEMGFGNYFVQVAIPSVSYNILSQKYSKLRKHYYSMPWEYDADIRGGACRSTGYAPWAEKANVWYWGVWEN